MIGLKRHQFVLARGIGVLVACLIVLFSCKQMNTKYAPGFSEEAFDQIHVGDTVEMVLEQLGKPLFVLGHEFFYYYRDGDIVFSVDTESGRVRYEGFLPTESEDAARYRSIITLTQLESQFGSPQQVIAKEFGQSNDPSTLSFVYGWFSKEAGQQPISSMSWRFVKIDFDKDTRRVLNKLAESRVEKLVE